MLGTFLGARFLLGIIFPAAITLILLVEIRQRIAYVFEHYLRRNGSKFEAMAFDGADEAREWYVLEALMYERSDGLCQGNTVRSLGQCLPVDVDRH